MAGAPMVRIFAVFGLGYFLSYSFRSIGPLIAPDLASELDLNARELGLLASVYFLAFFAAQPGIGIAMDRFGPARVNAALIAVAAVGAAIFATAHSLTGLAIGRGLIGLGIAGALVTAFKATVIWYPPRYREALAGALMAIGGLASMATATPAEWLMRAVGWRGVFWTLDALAVIVCALLMLAVPRHQAEAAPASAGGFGTIFRSRIFLSYLPTAFFGSGGFSAIQSLWAGPWLVEVAGLTRAATAQVLLVYGFSLFVGYLLIALFGARMQAIPRGPQRWYIASLALAYAALGLIVSNALPNSPWPWFAYGVTLGAGMLAYPLMTRAFPTAIAGRVVTAYNTVMFAGGFVIQAGLGIIIQHLVDGGTARPVAYQVAFGILLAAQVASLIWFVLVSRQGRAPA
ncbi:MAG: MFS transporter [Burkholderiales bacterium]|nr:MFS transporter [Burkholderiales bacterium]